MTAEDASPPATKPATKAAAPKAPPPAFTENVTPDGQGDGVITCVRCGASEVTFNAAKGMLYCAFCRHEWPPARLDEAMKLSEGIGELKGTTVSSAGIDITDSKTVVTMKCTGCGAEVMIDTAKNLQARCHWCKHTLELNNRIPNGAVPDGILPFQVTKEQAMAAIGEFVAKRKTFASKAFSKTFHAENVMGVYMPYMTVDGNVDVTLEGAGEVLRSTRKISDDKVEYHADQYAVKREIEAQIDDLIVETSSDKVNIDSNESTNNIINAVLPFDVKNVVRFDASYLGADFSSERRDMNVDHAQAYAADHFLTIARGIVAESVAGYDRGIHWESELVNVKGSRWTSVLLPVWLYGFVETHKGKQITHYLAVNGRTGATMGSVPINRRKACLVAWGVAIGISIFTWPLAIVIVAAS